MKQAVILGAGTGGTIICNRLGRKLDPREWKLTLVDQSPVHFYQPGFLFIPFGVYSGPDVIRPRAGMIPRGVEYIPAGIAAIEPEANRVKLEDGRAIGYDLLVIATGAKIAPEETPGLKEEGWGRDIFDFYTMEGALALRDALANFKGGDLVVHITEMPIKCPVAPLEFCFLADAWLRNRGLRSKTRITYVTPLSGAFTRQNCATVLGHLLKEKDIRMVPDFAVERVEPGAKKLVSYDGIELGYDLLVSIPTNKGDGVMERSGFGDELNFVPTDKHTLQSKVKENIFVLGDATNVPTSKAGSVAHFEAEVLETNILRYIAGKPLLEEFDGHTNCFIETGHGKAVLIDFNYEIEPVKGTFPLPVVGPMSLLKESRINHWGKMGFRWIYWNLLLKAMPMPLMDGRMRKWGKRLDTITPKA